MGRAARERRGQVPDGRAQPVRLPVIGVDIGGVLVDRVAEGSDTSFFGDAPMATPAVPGAFDGLRVLAGLVDHRIHIVSKAGPKIAALSRRWLGVHGVLDGTSVPASNVHFVRKRADKHEVCVRLGITHFVDDRIDVLEHLGSVPHRYLFVGGLGEHPAPNEIPSDVTLAVTWPHLIVCMRRSLDPADLDDQGLS